jgi:hypothetical protein
MAGTPVPYELKNDSIDTIPFKGSDAANDLVDLPTGVVLTVTNADPASLNAVMNGNNLVMNALVPAASNISVVVDDGSGPLNAFEYSVSIVADLTPVSVAPDTANIAHATQPVPAAPAAGGTPPATPPGP